MPPSLRDWLPEDHLAWFVLETVAQLDLAAFYESYRPDGHGRAAYEPSMMVALLLFAYSTKVYSSRGIECHCRQDIAYRVITANRVPDHATVARFVRRHQEPMGELFGSVLELCARPGWWGPGWSLSMARSCRGTRARSERRLWPDRQGDHPAGDRDRSGRGRGAR